jgi:hypothetical protein
MVSSSSSLLFFSNIFEILKYFPIYRMILKFEIIEFEAETWRSSSNIHTLDDLQVSAAADARMILKVTRAKVGGLSRYMPKKMIQVVAVFFHPKT